MRFTIPKMHTSREQNETFLTVRSDSIPSCPHLGNGKTKTCTKMLILKKESRMELFYQK